VSEPPQLIASQKAITIPKELGNTLEWRICSCKSSSKCQSLSR